MVRPTPTRRVDPAAVVPFAAAAEPVITRALI
jgi:hypothetical protein